MTGDDVTLGALRTFLLIARLGSFAKAARELCVTPSAVSRQMGSLENQLGCRLFDRTTRRLVLTVSGQHYAESVAVIIEQLDAARELAADAVKKPAGRLRIATSVAFADRWLIPRLDDFRSVHPELKIELVLSDKMVDLIDERIDVAIRLSARITGDFVVSKLMDTRYLVVAAPSFLKRCGTIERPEDLASAPCLCPPRPTSQSTWHFRRTGRVTHVAVSGSLAISSAVVLRRAALRGAGLALLAEWTVDRDITEGRLVGVLQQWEASPDNFDTAAWIVYPTRTYVPAKTRTLIAHLRASLVL